jgi:ornithine decarboxylase
VSYGVKTVTSRIKSAITDCSLPTPFLVIDQEQAAENYRNFSNNFKDAQVFYAVKANPHSDVLSRLAAEGASFDCASFNEILMVVQCGGEIEKNLVWLHNKKVI